VLDASTVFAADVAPQHLEPSTLDHPRIVDDMRAGYR
jgi:spermidine synthase